MTQRDVIGTRLHDRLYAAYNSHDLPSVAELYASDATHEDVAHGSPKYGVKAIVDGLQRFLSWFPDAQWQTGTAVVDHNGLTAVPYLLTASLQNQMGRIEPKGQRILLRGVLVLHLNDGRIQRSEDYWDSATFQKQLANNGEEEK
ncbi:nuclear transport factor 2 family protein [Phyllobacterium lublinensis]|uniref:nuclear transport factor 2 family protein n=1 Tax=Phyllobacterium lublinensis TaxID=2875708 RepID=UPI001CCBDE59|nr:nuclear transport factor 2 family protein [Phyllobacterium sp. 2063]MBZ9653458.1 nuclear transport factor 2 family protein [Phyllobacterium sp. 2063]